MRLFKGFVFVKAKPKLHPRMKRSYSTMNAGKPPIRRRRPYRRPSPYGNQVQRRMSGPTYKVIRLKATVTGSFTLTPRDLLAICGCYCQSANSLRIIYETVRVGHVKVVGVPPTSGSMNEVKLEFKGGGNKTSGDLLINSSNNSVTSPQLYGKPSRYSTSSDWNNASVDDALFVVTCQSNSILEVGLWVCEHEDGGTPYAIVSSGQTAGNFIKFCPTSGLETIN